MIKVKITRDGVKGADDGATVRPYAKGVIYTVSESLAEAFIEAGEATEVAEEKQSVTDKLKTTKEKAAAEKAEADRVAAEKAEADRVAAEKAEADRAKPVMGLPGLPKK